VGIDKVGNASWESASMQALLIFVDQKIYGDNATPSCLECHDLIQKRSDGSENIQGHGKIAAA
jgi:hypothetical protein